MLLLLASLLFLFCHWYEKSPQYPPTDNHRGLSLQNGGIWRIVDDGPRVTPNDRLCRGRPKPALPVLNEAKEAKPKGAVPNTLRGNQQDHLLIRRPFVTIRVM